MLTLKDFSTRELLVKRMYIFKEGEYKIELEKCVSGGTMEKLYVTFDELFEELNQREHVPSKKEGKILRRLMATHGISAEEARKQFPSEFQDKSRIVLTKEKYVELLKRNKFSTRFSKHFVIG